VHTPVQVSGRRYAIKSIDLTKIAHDKRDMLEAEVLTERLAITVDLSQHFT